MPPKSKPRPPEKDVQFLSDWIGDRVKAAEAARRAQGRVVLRRLNRVEYENTVRDLLGVDVDLKELLPSDSSADGFDNVGERPARLLLPDGAVPGSGRHGPERGHRQPAQAADAHQEALQPQGDAPGQGHRARAFIASWTTTPWCCFSSSPWQRGHAVAVLPAGPRQLPLPHLRLRLSERRQAGHLSRDAGTDADGGRRRTWSATSTPRRQADRRRVRRSPGAAEHDPHPAVRPGRGRNVVDKIGADKYEGPGLAVQWVEVEGPLHDTWPPAEPSPHLRRPAAGDGADLQRPRPRRGRLERPRGRCRAHPPQLRPPRLSAGGDRRRRQAVPRPRQGQAGREALVRAGGARRPHGRAWCRRSSCSSARSPASSTTSPWPAGCRTSCGARCPTRNCSTLAEQKKLSQPDTLRQQVERMLKDPKAAAFTENFVGQWLGLRDIDSTEPEPHPLSRIRRHAQGVDGQGDGSCSSTKC